MSPGRRFPFLEALHSHLCSDVTLSRSFYRTDAETLARKLLGQRLVRILPSGDRLSGLIVETEAYLGEPDAASHAYRLRRTPRNEAMYARAGTAYIYFTYGMHFCFNVVCGRVDQPLAVLVRALQPEEGVEHMRRARSRLQDHDLCSGPAKLCQALDLNRDLNAIDLTTDPRLFLERARPRLDDTLIVKTPRIGVDYAGSWATKPLRFFLRGNPHISRKTVPNRRKNR